MKHLWIFATVWLMAFVFASVFVDTYLSLHFLLKDAVQIVIFGIGMLVIVREGEKEKRDE